jgi:hypothetical protein
MAAAKAAIEWSTPAPIPKGATAMISPSDGAAVSAATAARSTTNSANTDGWGDDLELEGAGDGWDGWGDDDSWGADAACSTGTASGVSTSEQA